MFWIIALALALAGALFFYAKFIRAKMASTAQVTGKAETVAASAGFTKLWAMIEGWKTIVLAAVGGAVNLLAAVPNLLAYLDPELLKAWQALPWASVFDAHTAGMVNFALAFLIPVTHAIGLYRAAKTPPRG